MILQDAKGEEKKKRASKSPYLVVGFRHHARGRPVEIGGEQLAQAEVKRIGRRWGPL